MSFKTCLLNLNFPNQVLQLKASFQETQSHRLPCLEVDSYIPLNSYTNLTQNLLEKSLKAFVYPVDEDVQKKEYSKMFDFLVETGTIIKASSAFGIEKIYFFIPFRNSKIFGFYEIRMKDLVPSSIDDYADYISELLKAHDNVRESFDFASREINKLETYKYKLIEICQKIEDSCKETKENITTVRNKICELNSEFKVQEENFKRFECIKCRTYAKDVVFLPCGHISVCSRCFKDEFKLLVDFPVPNGSLKCLVCGIQVKKTIQYSM